MDDGEDAKDRIAYLRLQRSIRAGAGAAVIALFASLALLAGVVWVFTCLT